jgi:membrane protease YdiL (CAAX protease family)
MTEQLAFLWRSRAGRWLFMLIVIAPSLILGPLLHHYTDIQGVILLGVIGILVTGLPVALATLHLRMRNETWRRFGLRRPTSWTRLALQTLLVTVVVLLFFVFVIGPVSQLTGERPDVSHLLPIRGNLPILLWALFAIWISAAFFEEMFVRGYLLNEIADLLGGRAAAVVVAVLVSSFFFGIAHLYQGASGVIVTGLAGLIFAIAYLACGRNLWPVILAHGLVNSLSVIQIYFMPTS